MSSYFVILVTNYRQQPARADSAANTMPDWILCTATFMLQSLPAASTIRSNKLNINAVNEPEPQILLRQPQRSLPFLSILGLFGLAIGFTISSLDPFIFNEKVRLLAPAYLKNTTLGFITIMALLAALVVQPLIGQWSDRTRSRWGRRAPYLIVGVVGASFSLAWIVTANNLWLLVMGAVLFSTFSNTIQATWQALIPDYVAEPQRGAAAGFKTVLELTGVVTGVVVVGLALSRGNLWGAPLVAIALFWLILLVTLFVVGRPPAPVQLDPQARGHHPARGLLLALRHAPAAFYWWMLNRFLFWSSAIAIRTFILNYLEDVMGVDPAQAQILASRLFVVLGLGVFILALPAGAVADRLGRRPVLIAAGLMAGAGVGLFIIWPGYAMLYVAGGLIAAGAGIFASASWALATDLAPGGEGALYLGLANGATVVGSIGGRLGGPLIDGINQLSGTITLGYVLVFTIAALFFAGSSVVVFKIPEYPANQYQGRF